MRLIMKYKTRLACLAFAVGTVFSSLPLSGQSTSHLLKIQTVSCSDGKTKPGANPDECALGQMMTIGVDAASLEAWKADTANDAAKLVLVLNQRVLKGVTALPPFGSAQLNFELKRNPNDPDNRSAWNALLSHSDKKGLIPLTVSLALGDKVASSDSPQPIMFQVFPGYFWGVVAIVAGLLVVFVVLAR